MSGLGRVQPSDWEHVVKYPLAALGAVPTGEVESEETQIPVTEDLRPRFVPVVLGTNWYSGMDTPYEQNGSWYINEGGLGSIRGGHCYVLEPHDDPEVKGVERDNAKWWQWYNQGVEGACVGFGCSRAASLYHRHQFDAWWLYDQARILDGDPSEEGAQVRSGLEVLRTKGHRVAKGVENLRVETDEAVEASNGIKAYRWASTTDDIIRALGNTNLDYVTLLNSWGKDYPHRVRMPLSVLHRLLSESGEAAVITEQ